MCKLNDTSKDSIAIRRAILALLNGKTMSAKEIHKQMNTDCSYNKFSYHINALVSSKNIVKAGKQSQNFLYEVINAEYQPKVNESKPAAKKPLNVWEYLGAAA